MGAVFGIVGEGSVDEVQSMGKRMAYRGNIQNVWSPSIGVILGQISWSKEELGGEGPVAADIQLYNQNELIELINLRREDSNDLSDTALAGEVINRLGIKGIQSLRGYFSLAFFNEKEKAVVLACDHAGFKLVYFVELENRVAFASEYKALLALPDVLAQPNRNAIQYYLSTHSFLMGSSYLSSVNSLRPAEVLIIKDRTISRGRYWKPTYRAIERSQNGHAEAFRDSFLYTIRKQSRGYNRVGLTIGQGLDAAAILAGLREKRPEAEVVSFTIGRDGDDPEILGGRLLSRYFKTEHHEKFVNPEDLQKDLPLLVWVMEDCSAREEALLQFQVIQLARNYVPILFGGHMADSLLGGMPRFRLIRLGELLPLVKKPLSEIYQLTQSGKSPETIGGRILQWALYRRNGFSPPRILGSNIAREVFMPDTLNDGIITGITNFKDHGYLEPSHEIARIRFMAPFADPDLADCSLTIPERQKVGWWRQKILLREAMAGLLPPPIARRRKAIQRIAHDVRLSNILESMCDQYLSPEMVRKRGFVEPLYVERLRRRPYGKLYPEDRLYLIWRLISIEIWARQFMDHRGLPWGFDVLRES